MGIDFYSFNVRHKMINLYTYLHIKITVVRIVLETACILVRVNNFINIKSRIIEN